jgi:uncharacterized membrane protein
MGKNRLEAFSDGVLAILITIMVLELKVPQGTDLAALRPLIPIFASYALSFVFIGIYWNNHHHLLHSIHKVNGKILWANLHLLFWLSLIPFASGWMGENHFEPLTVMLYGTVLLSAGVAYYLLVTTLASLHGNASLLSQAVGDKAKEKISLLIYFMSIPLAYWQPWLSLAGYFFVAVMWLVPDSRIERQLGKASESRKSQVLR